MSEEPVPRPSQRWLVRLAAVAGVLVAAVVVAGLVGLFAGSGSSGGGRGSVAGGGQSLAQPDEAGRGSRDGVSAGQRARGGGVEAEGKPAPSVEFTMFDGTTVTLADWEGQPVVVNFWASWCPPCVGEMKNAFEPAHQRYDDVAFLGVDVQDSRDKALEVVERTGVTYPLAADPNGELFSAFGGFGMPMTVFLSEEGRVVGSHSGALTRAQLQARIEQLLLEDA